jgi:hypothetical protein
VETLIETSLMRVTPVAVALMTMIRFDSAVTGMDRPVVRPLEIAPSDTTPVSAGARVTIAPGIGV